MLDACISLLESAINQPVKDWKTYTAHINALNKIHLHYSQYEIMQKAIVEIMGV